MFSLINSRIDSLIHFAQPYACTKSLQYNKIYFILHKCLQHMYFLTCIRASIISTICWVCFIQVIMYNMYCITCILASVISTRCKFHIGYYAKICTTYVLYYLYSSLHNINQVLGMFHIGFTIIRILDTKYHENRNEKIHENFN